MTMQKQRANMIITLTLSKPRRMNKSLRNSIVASKEILQ